MEVTTARHRFYINKQPTNVIGEYSFLPEVAERPEA
jgi:hypothetical protein